MTIDQLVKEVHENAKEKGWWDEERSFGDIVALSSRRKSDMKWYCYRRKDGMEIRRDRWSPWLRLKGYRLIEVVQMNVNKNVKG